MIEGIVFLTVAFIHFLWTMANHFAIPEKSKAIASFITSCVSLPLLFMVLSWIYPEIASYLVRYAIAFTIIVSLRGYRFNELYEEFHSD